MRKALTVLAVAFVAALAPAEFSATGGDGVVRLNGVCAQASECKKLNDDYICSTYHDDYIGFVCSAGCIIQPN